MDLVLRHIDGATLPLAARADHYVLIDLASSRPDADLRGLMEAVLEEALEAGEVTDAALAESEAQRAAILERVPTGRLGEGGDIAAACVYLASQEAAYVTGQTLHVNGGMAMI